MDSKIVEIEAPEKYLAITWQVNNFCNFSCSYCNPGNWIGDVRNEEDAQLYINNLKSIVDKYYDAGYKYFKFFFSGGEPTAWKNFLPICEWAKEYIPECTIAINTNLSRPVKWWEKNIDMFDDVVASFHVEHANKEKYEENSIYLCDKLNYHSTKMLLHEERFWEVVSFGNHLKTVMPNYFIEWTPLYNELTQEALPWEYADPDKVKFIEEHNIEQEYTIEKPTKDNHTASYVVFENGMREICISNDVIVNRQNFFTGWDCDVGDCVFISPIGRISLASCGVTGEIGHILNDISKVKPKTVTCTKNHCMCGTDIIIPKRFVDRSEVIAVGTD